MEIIVNRKNAKEELIGVYSFKNKTRFGKYTIMYIQIDNNTLLNINDFTHYRYIFGKHGLYTFMKNSKMNLYTYNGVQTSDDCKYHVKFTRYASLLYWWETNKFKRNVINKIQNKIADFNIKLKNKFGKHEALDSIVDCYNN